MDVLQTYAVPRSTCSPLVQKTNQEKKNNPTEILTSFLPFRGPAVGGDTFSRIPVAPIIGPEKKVAMSPSSITTVHEGQYDISPVSVSWLIRPGGNPLYHK